jgi:DNA-binding XRE family transcriptional regulator
MAASALLITDRPQFEALWRPVCEQHGLSATARPPSAFAVERGDEVEPGRAIVFDAARATYDEDELLAHVGHARARGAVVAVSIDSEPLESVDDLLEELCPGLVARTPNDANRVASLLARRLDSDRKNRLEFVTLSPANTDLLVVMGDGAAVELSRPLGEEDDGTDIVEIELSESGENAKIGFASGHSFVLHADAAGHRGDNGASNGATLDGHRLGARLRQLRKAAGLTQAELSRRTGIHRPNIARVEAGRHTPSLETLARLATAIGIPASRILSDE